MSRPDKREYSYWSVPVPSLSEWTVSRVRNAIREHESGVFANSSLLATAMERNPRVFGALNTRVLGVVGLPFRVDQAAKNKRRSAYIAARFWIKWPKITDEGTLQEILGWCLKLGFCWVEQVYKTRDGGEWTPKLKVVHPYNTEYDSMANAWRIFTKDGWITVDPEDPHWVLFSYGGTQPWMRGVVRVLGLPDTIRSYAVRDWARRSEVHGLPVRMAIVPFESSEADKERFFDDVSALGTETTVIAPQSQGGEGGFDLQFREAGDSKGELFSSIIGHVNTDVAIAILGQNLTQETNGGSYAAAKVHDRVRGDYLEADAQLLSSAFKEKVSTPWAVYNFGSSELAPEPIYDASIPEDNLAKAQTLSAIGDAVTKINDALEKHAKATGEPRKVVDLAGILNGVNVQLVDAIEESSPEPSDPPQDGQQASDSEPQQQEDATAAEDTQTED